MAKGMQTPGYWFEYWNWGRKYFVDDEDLVAKDVSVNYDFDSLFPMPFEFAWDISQSNICSSQFLNYQVVFRFSHESCLQCFSPALGLLVVLWQILTFRPSLVFGEINVFFAHLSYCIIGQLWDGFNKVGFKLDTSTLFGVVDFRISTLTNWHQSVSIL